MVTCFSKQLSQFLSTCFKFARIKFQTNWIDAIWFYDCKTQKAYLLIYLLTYLPVPWLHVKQNYFSLCRRLTETVLFHRVETCMKLFQNYFTDLLQIMNIIQHVHCR